MRNLAGMVQKQLNEQPILLVCLIGSSITKLLSVLFSTYLILWIQSFDNLTEDDSKNIYFNMMVISVLISTMILPCLAKFIDNSPAIRIVPFTFLIRFVFCLMFSTLTSPNSKTSYTICVLIIVATILESSLIDSIFSKNQGKATRGLMYGLQMFFINAGIFVYSIAGGYGSDYFGPSLPFVLIGICDIIFAVYVGY
jgi:predicted MFS family arabinose efflux permease